MDRFIDKVITEKVEGKFKIQGQTTADNYCNRHLHTVRNILTETIAETIPCTLSLHDMCSINGHIK